MQNILKFIAHNKAISSIVVVVVVLGGVGIWALFSTDQSANLNSFSDNFSTNTTSDYTDIGGTWKIAQGVAALTEPIATPTTAIGVTNIMLNSSADSGYKKWELKVDVTPQSSKTSVVDAALIFNYKDSNNYYYALFTSQGGSIHKLYAGQETTLTSFSFNLQTGKTVELSVRRSGSDYKAYEGSKYLAKTSDSSLTDGKVGVGSRNSYVNFDNLEFKVKGQALPPAPTPTPTPEPSPSPSPSPTPPPTPAPTPVSGVINATNCDQLATALKSAAPGSTIQLAAGTYAMSGCSNAVKTNLKLTSTMTIASAGTATNPITLTGPTTAILDGGGLSGEYGLYFKGASYWKVTGISVANGSKGIVMDASNNITLDHVHVYNIADEGVHFRDFTTDSTIQNSVVEQTGRKTPEYGEGVYIGSANSNWATYSNGLQDKTDRINVLDNNIKNNGAENIDIKEGTTGGIITGNTFDAVNMSGQNFADSMIDVKGDGYTIVGNHGTRSGTSALLDGFQVHQVSLQKQYAAKYGKAPFGNNNVFGNNNFSIGYTDPTTHKVNAGTNGYAINVQTKGHGNVVYGNNTETGFSLGVSNVPLQ